MEAYQKLEIEFGEWLSARGYIGAPHVVVCSSGTAALHLALEVAAKIFAPTAVNKTVVVPEFTMIACARTVVLAGLVPCFVDCRNDLLLDPGQMPWRPFAIMPVHVYGRKFDLNMISPARRGSFVVEDLAEGHGITPHPLTDAACYSFYRNKIIAGEEGGAVVFQECEPAGLARQLRNMGWTKEHDCLHLPRGCNYRLSNAHAELILGSLAHVEENLRIRDEIAVTYDQVLPDTWRMPPRDVCWVYDLRIPGCTEERQNRIVRRLQEAGVAARHAFKPMSRQPEFFDPDYPRLNADRLSGEVIYLPADPGQRNQLQHNSSALLQIVDETFAGRR